MDVHFKFKIKLKSRIRIRIGIKKMPMHTLFSYWLRIGFALVANAMQVVLRLYLLMPVFRIRIRIHVFLGLPDPNSDPIVRGMDPHPDPALDPDISIIFVTSI